MKRKQKSKKRLLAFFLSIILVAGILPTTAFAADTHKIKIAKYQGCTGDDTTVQLSNTNPEAGETVTVTVSTTRSGSSPSNVTFYSNITWEEIEIPGYSISRNYDKPNQFSFVMPDQDVVLQIVCAKDKPLYYNQYYTAPEGTATPASDDNSIQAVKYTAKKELADLFTSAEGIDGYLIKFSDGNNYGVVDASGENLVYTPNSAAAGKKVTICVKAFAGGKVSGEIQFPVSVNSVPIPSKSRDTSLSSLKYSIDGGAEKNILLESGKTEYTIALPFGTEIDKTITVDPTAKDTKASISSVMSATTGYVASIASFIVQAEDSSASQQYRVKFTVDSPEVESSVKLGTKTLSNGDTVLISTDKSVTFSINHGSGVIGNGSAGYSSDGDLVNASGAFCGAYPSTYQNVNLKAKQLGTTNLVIKFYKENTTDFEGLTPTKIMKLTLTTVADYTRVNEAINRASALNKEDYKDFSAVTAAVNAVVSNKNATEQETVDGYADAIENAINGLELKTVAPPAAKPQIISGANQSVEQGKAATFISSAELKDFQKVLLDGKELSSNYYTLKEGSTIVSLKAEFVKTLSAGKHTISIVSTTGLAETEFTVIKASTSVGPGTNSTQTGDSSNMVLWIALLMISAGGACVLLLKRKKSAK